MSRFAAYDPDVPGGPPPSDLRVRRAVASDVPTLAALRAGRDEISVEEATRVFERLLAGRGRVFVAETSSRVAGYGAVDLLAPPGLPAGWYLTGVVVAPALRRRGLGTELTRARLAWISARAREAFYFVNEANRASLDLHAAFGFALIERDVAVPGVEFRGGRGLLWRVAL